MSNFEDLTRVLELYFDVLEDSVWEVINDFEFSNKCLIEEK